MRDDSLRLADMLEALERVRSFAAAGPAGVLSDTRTADALAYEMLRLGEAASHVSATLRAAHPEVPWGALVRQRNRMVHEYFRTDVTNLWRFVVEDLDRLERAIRRIVASPTDG